MYADLLVHCRDDGRWDRVIDFARHFVDDAGGRVTCLREGDAVADSASLRCLSRGTLSTDQALLHHAALADALLLDGYCSDLVTLRRVVCETARACVVVPAAHRAFAPPRRIGIGWDASLQCRRALHAAMPMLRCAQHVLLLAPAVHAGDVDDAMAYLRRFGIQAAVVDSSAAPQQACARLSDLSRQHGIDLLVAGAFPHAGFGDWAGAATLVQLLQAAQTPLLLAH